MLKEQTGLGGCLAVGGAAEGSEDDLQAFSWEEMRELFLRRKIMEKNFEK